MTTSKFLLHENFLNTDKKLFVESKYFSLYDILLSESIDDELSESVDIYSSFNDELDCYMIDIDLMLQVAVEHSMFYDLLESKKSFRKYDISILVLNEIVRIYNALFVYDISILTRMTYSIDIITESLYFELIITLIPKSVI